MFLEIIKMAFESLLAKKTRTFLSMLGIIIGVSTVIAVFAIGQGAQQAVDDQFAGLSAKSIMIMGSMGGGPGGAKTTSKLDIEDVEVIREQAQYVGTATGLFQGQSTVSYSSEEASYSIVGTDLDFFTISQLEIEQGRIFNDEEILDKEKVAILGSDVIEDLYEDGENPIDTNVKINGKVFTVVGVFEENGGSLGRTSKDEAVYIPYKTAESVLGDSGSIMLMIEANSVDNVSLASDEITEILREEHKLKDTAENDFNIMDAGSMVGAAQESAELMSILLTAIAAITLLVSGIGIMNVMFVTVAERTKEIGISKAIGGKQSDILTQFLLESIILSTSGGFIGIALGQLAIPILSYFNLMQVASSVKGPLIGFSFSVIVGVIFGFYPALKASQLDPVDALRSE